MTRKQIDAFYRRRYTAPQMVVAAAGNLDHADGGQGGPGGVRGPSARVGPRRRGAARATGGAGPRRRSTCVRNKDTEQAHVVLGCAGHRPRTTSGASRSACSTTCSAAACRAGCSRRSGRSAGWRTRSTRTPRSTPTRAVRRLRRLRARQGRRGARHRPGRAGPGGGRGRHRRRGGARQGHAQGRARAGPGGHRLADEPARQGRAALRRAAVGVDEVLARVDAVTPDDGRARWPPSVLRPRRCRSPWSARSTTSALRGRPSADKLG